MWCSKGNEMDTRWPSTSGRLATWRILTLVGVWDVTTMYSWERFNWVRRHFNSISAFFSPFHFDVCVVKPCLPFIRKLLRVSIVPN